LINGAPALVSRSRTAVPVEVVQSSGRRHYCEVGKPRNPALLRERQPGQSSSVLHFRRSYANGLGNVSTNHPGRPAVLNTADDYQWYQGARGDTSHLVASGSTALYVCPSVATQYWLRAVVWSSPGVVSCYTDTNAVTLP
jgi:hypothetical protein